MQEIVEAIVAKLLPHWQTNHESLRHMIRAEFADLRKVVATLKDMLMTLQVDVANLVAQVAANGQIEEASAIALTGLSQKADTLQQSVDALQAQVAAGLPVSPDDVAAIQKATADLAKTAGDLVAATPQGTGTQPVTVTPDPSPPAPVVTGDGTGAGPQGSKRRF